MALESPLPAELATFLDTLKSAPISPPPTSNPSKKRRI
jgi:hypothetical protein